MRLEASANPEWSQRPPDSLRQVADVTFFAVQICIKTPVYTCLSPALHQSCHCSIITGGTQQVHTYEDEGVSGMMESQWCFPLLQAWQWKDITSFAKVKMQIFCPSQRQERVWYCPPLIHLHFYLTSTSCEGVCINFSLHVCWHNLTPALKMHQSPLSTTPQSSPPHFLYPWHSYVWAAVSQSKVLTIYCLGITTCTSLIQLLMCLWF